jgi:taurine--2-oxoglutarate transaminase
MRQHIADAFRERAYVGGLTYNSHPMGCAAALAVIEVMEQDGLVERSARMGEVMRGHHARLMERHPSVGGHRNLGLFGVLDLVRDRRTFEPMAPFGGTSEEMQAIHRHFRDHGLYAFLRYNMIHTNPPLTISEEELAEGVDIIDAALDLADAGVRG